MPVAPKKEPSATASVASTPSTSQPATKESAEEDLLMFLLRSFKGHLAEGKKETTKDAKRAMTLESRMRPEKRPPVPAKRDQIDTDKQGDKIWDIVNEIEKGRAAGRITAAPPSPTDPAVIALDKEIEILTKAVAEKGDHRKREAQVPKGGSNGVIIGELLDPRSGPKFANRPVIEHVDDNEDRDKEPILEDITCENQVIPNRPVGVNFPRPERRDPLPPFHASSAPSPPLEEPMEHKSSQEETKLIDRPEDMEEHEYTREMDGTHVVIPGAGDELPSEDKPEVSKELHELNHGTTKHEEINQKIKEILSRPIQFAKAGMQPRNEECTSIDCGMQNTELAAMLISFITLAIAFGTIAIYLSIRFGPRTWGYMKKKFKRTVEVPNEAHDQKGAGDVESQQVGSGFEAISRQKPIGQWKIAKLR